DLVGRRQSGVNVVDQLDLGALEPTLQLLDVTFVDVELSDRLVHRGMRKHAELLSLDDQSLDFFEFLEFRCRHLLSVARSSWRSKRAWRPDREGGGSGRPQSAPLKHTFYILGAL